MVEKRTNAQLVEDVEQLRETERQLLKRSAELEALFRISNILSQPGTYEEKVNNVLEELLGAAEASWVNLRVTDPLGGGLRLIARTGQDSRPLASIRNIGGSVSARAMESGQPIVANDYQSQPDAEQSTVLEGARSVMSLPIKITGDTFAIANVISKEVGHFNPERVRLLTAIVDGLGPLLENAKLYQELHSGALEMAAVDEIARILTSTLEIDQAYDQFAVEVKKLVEFDRMAIRSIDQPAGTSIVKFTSGLTPPGTGVGTIRDLRDTRSGELVATGKTIVVDDHTVEPELLWDNLYGLRSLITVPLVYHANVVGAISLRSRHIGSYGKREQMILERLANQIAPAIENSKLFETTRQRETELEALFKISRILAEPGVYEDKLHSVLAELLLTAEGAWVNLLVPDPVEKRMKVIAHARSDGQSIPVVPYSKGLALDVLDSGELLVENDYTSNPNADPNAIAVGANSMLGLPIKTADETFAVVGIMSNEFDHFNPERVRLLTAIVDGLGPLLENARLNEEITAKKEALRQSQKLESVGQLAAGVAHEVNNPLAAILGFSRLLLSQEIPDQAKQDVQIIFDEAQRGTTIIQDLLSFARKGKSEKKAIDISGGLNRVLNLKAADFRANHVKVNLEIEDDLPEVEADEQQLQQVYLNLLTNAQHAMSDANDGGNIAIRCKRVGDVLRLRFIDDGPGMTKETMGKVFEPFFTTKAEGKGTGLGLSVCYGIIEDHGGRLWVESEPGAGATFLIDLPCLVEAESKA